MNRCCSNCGWLEVNPSGAMFCGYSEERTWKDECCMAWKYKKEPRTNADRIRTMSDEELAYWYFNEFFRKVPYCRKDECYEDSPCEECLLDWLKEETL